MPTGVIAWLKLLGALVVWAAHFAGLYALFSWMDLAEANQAPGRWIAAGFSVACLAAVAGAAILVWRDARLPPWSRSVALSGALVAALAIVFQTAPILFL